MDALYFRVSSERQTTENQFEDLLCVAEKDGSSRDWGQIRQALSRCVYEEQLPTSNGRSRIVYRVRHEVAAELGRSLDHFKIPNREKDRSPGSLRCPQRRGDRGRQARLNHHVFQIIAPRPRFAMRLLVAPNAK